MDALDSLMRTENYDLDVLMVEMPLKDEVRLNVVLNNTDNMGVFDFGKIQELSNEFGLEIGDDFGFSQEVIDIQFPEVAQAAIIEEYGDEPPPPPKVASAEDIAKMKEMKHEAREALKAENAEFGDWKGEPKGILTIVFKCETDKKEWLKSINLPEDKNVVNIDDIEIPLVNELRERFNAGYYDSNNVDSNDGQS